MAAPTYPFTAIVGAHDLSTALLLTALSPEIGGVLVRGEKGTAKSTMVRALAGVLPEQQVVGGCRFGCDPARDDGCPDSPHDGARTTTRPARLVELPVGATEDRVVGALDLRRALGEGDAAYQPGLLAEAHRGILYVDEVNLLHDHLVDVLLDAAAMGTNTVERDGISLSHPARITLVGTMNPEEGELRPQLLDRFGLTVEVRASRDPQERTEVVRRRLAFDADPVAFRSGYAEAEAALTARLAQARVRLAEVELGDTALRAIARVCAGFDVDGMRADIVTARTAVAHAAWEGRDRVTRADIRAAALLALPHRRRRSPFDEPGLDEALLDALLDEELPEGPDDEPEGPQGPDEPDGPDDGPDGPDGHDGDTDGEGPDDGQHHGGPSQSGPDDAPHHDRPTPETSSQTPPERPQDGSGAVPTPVGVAAPRAPYRTRRLAARGLGSGPVGRRSPALTTRGRTVGVHPAGREPHGAAVHLPATVRAGATRRATERSDRATTPVTIATSATTGATGAAGQGRRGWSAEDLRFAVTRGKEANLVLLVVDASGSMAARRRMEEVKTAVLSLLMDAYQRRDRVGLISFRGTDAELVLPPTSSVEAAAARLQELGHGGRTPLAEGLVEAHRVLARERVRDRDQRALLVLVTDGRATAGASALARAQHVADRWAGREHGCDTVVVDCESGRFRMGLAADLASRMGAEHLPLEHVAAGSLVDIVTTRSRKAA
ncbi:magnesium chelatase subunit D family protein [Ornithinimicrobium tianjinense]|uniref:Mg-protoporphyrin IX chelatase n=1 Tax=Ornithinimicrobium tianjinense TaxID=1195761 RepID=A0A917F5H8_9MICO|nr:magnesium chelatase subunit D family protein [Ornithinimicrobium tianjinense]GGF51932.1 magnesium chelatase [Ornithinimicrobium tianjinense]